MTDSPTDKQSFEDSLAELERVVRVLEDGQTGLEDALAHYERGVGLLKHCFAQLRQAEQKILLITGEDADGQPLTRPFEHAAALELVKAETARRPKPAGR